MYIYTKNVKKFAGCVILERAGSVVTVPHVIDNSCILVNYRNEDYAIIAIEGTEILLYTDIGVKKLAIFKQSPSLVPTIDGAAMILSVGNRATKARLLFDDALEIEIDTD